MPDSRAQTPSRGGVLLALAVLAALAGLGALYLGGKAGEAAAAAADARERLAEDRELAERYRKAAADNLVVSGDLAEAQSSEFIQRALSEAKIRAVQRYGEPMESGGRFDKVETTITIKEEASFSSLVAFLREVEKERPQLTLLGAKLTRAKNQDKWQGSLTYGALIPAISHN